MILLRLVLTTIFLITASSQIAKGDTLKEGAYQDKISLGYKVCGLYLCTAASTGEKLFDYNMVINAIGREYQYEVDCFVPFLPNYEDSRYIDKPGDTLMILFNENRYKVIVASMGLFYEDSHGLVVVCNMIAIDSMPVVRRPDFYIVLRKDLFYEGKIQLFNRCEINNKSVQSTIDSLNSEFIKNIALRGIDYVCADSIKLFSEISAKSPNFYFVAFTCEFNAVEDYSALFLVSKNKKNNKVLLLEPPEFGSHGWNFISSFDLNNDGNKEFLIETPPYEGYCLGICTIVGDKWIVLFGESYGG